MFSMKKPIVIGIVVVVVIIIAFILSKTQNSTVIDPVEETLIPVGEIKASIVTVEQPEYVASYPEFRPYDDERSDILNNYVFKIVTDFIEQATTDRDATLPNGNMPHTMEVETETLSSANTQSFILSEYYYTGGANPYGQYTAFTFNDTDEHVTLDKFVTDELTFYAVVKDHLRNQKFADQMGSEILNLVALDSISLADMDYALNDTDLVLYFDEYEIGPGALGGFSTKIPRSSLADSTTL